MESNQQQNTANNTNTPPQDPDMARLDALATLMDNQFKIPFTNWRFGLDSLVGLIPYVGDLAGLIVSGILIRTMLKRGAGPILMLRMLGNVVLDTMVGVIPVLGDFFDFGYKANRRNVDLLKRYYSEGKKRPNAKVSVGILGLLFLLIFVGVIWLTIKGIGWIWAAIAAAI
jgi:Domain of unknown function (DUF4112)